MAHRKHHRRHHRSYSKNIMDQSVSLAKSTSRKFMPKVKHSLENVGSKVVKTGEQSIPFLQRVTRKLFGMFSLGRTRRRRRH
jgi:hypothetical protein